MVYAKYILIKYKLYIKDIKYFKNRFVVLTEKKIENNKLKLRNKILTTYLPIKKLEKCVLDLYNNN